MHKLQFLAAGICAALSTPALATAAPPAKPTATAPDPERLKLAARVSAVLWPNGTYVRIFQGMTGGEDGLFDMVLDLRPGEIMGAMFEGAAAGPEAQAAKDAPPKKPSPTLRESIVAEDPYFEERMRISMKVAEEEMTRLAAPIEPKLREGLAKSIARRFTTAQLVPIATFFETDAGRAYAEQSFSMFVDKDVMLALISSVPAVVKEVPGIMENIEKATAHLPKPKHKPPEVTDDSDTSDTDDTDEKTDSDPPST